MALPILMNIDANISVKFFTKINEFLNSLQLY